MNRYYASGGHGGHFSTAAATVLKKVPKLVSASEAVKHIESGSRIYAHSVAQFPKALVNALADHVRAGDLRAITLHHLHVEGDNPFDSADLKNCASRHFFVGKNSREAVNSGHGAYIPSFLSDIPVMMRHGAVPLDWTFLNVSPPDKHGYCSLGTEVCAALPAAECSKHIIAQINPSVPRTHGNSSIHMSRFDYVVDVSGDKAQAIPTVTAKDPGSDEMKLGQHLAAMIPDGATLQVGIGAIPDAVLQSLKNHKNLGVHSEMIGDGIMKLMKSGAISNAYKRYLPNRTVTSFLLGSREFYDYVDDNPGFHLTDASITNNPGNIALNDKVVAINSAIEVDLTGQVCADSVGTRIISGVGGQLDFETGAAMSNGGIPTICLLSQDKKRKTSTIVSTLKSGAGVTTTRYHAHWIVTEQGAVNLWGKDLQERARLLISIAHPDHRQQLAKEAFERFKIVIT